ncbi:RHS repeat-associated core domain-containing protein [uncultured Nonlabens sp.]|uniref:RHS repeat-associated core domain-containing protein n=1 Tax=uncultured Nonlabens sp. TaxID=859306 RepID=UPI002617DA7E|nr:RHS repeat-associated core domain-containing protein [uncultured Nonlabens sp.]
MLRNEFFFNDYYPFGLEHKGYGLAQTADHPYKFGGKEFNEELGLDWYDVSARNYDPALGRWMNVDPLAEQTMEPYLYAGNNPIRYTDPTGMSKEDYVLGENGYYWDENVRSADDADLGGNEYIGKSIIDVNNHYEENNYFSSLFGIRADWGTNVGTPPAEVYSSSLTDTWADDWENSGTFLGDLTYGIANDLNVMGQAFNPFDNEITSLSGRGLNDAEITEHGLMGLANFMPAAKGVQGIKSPAGASIQSR